MTATQAQECWIWRPYVEGEGYAYAYDADGLDLPHYRAVLMGEPLVEPLPKPSFGRFSPGPLPDALGAPLGCMIVEPKLRALLSQESGAPLQFIPVQVKARRKAPEYAVANVLVKVSCLDEQRSRLTRNPENPAYIEAVELLVLRPLPVDVPGIFHLEELSQVLVVRDTLRQKMLATSESPGVFVPIDSYSYG